MQLAASQWGHLGFCMNCDRNDTLNTMSRHVPSAAYISKPMASQYRMSLMSSYWHGVDRHCERVSWWCGSRGVVKGFESCKENLSNILSMYDCCKNVICHFSQSLLTSIPNSQHRSPRSLILKNSHSWFLKTRTIFLVFPAMVRSSMSTVTTSASWSWYL